MKDCKYNPNFSVMCMLTIRLVSARTVLVLNIFRSDPPRFANCPGFSLYWNYECLLKYDDELCYKQYKWWQQNGCWPFFLENIFVLGKMY